MDQSPNSKKSWGLVDTVLPYDPENNSGQVFASIALNPLTYTALVRSGKHLGIKIVEIITARAMSQEFSWQRSA